MKNTLRNGPLSQNSCMTAMKINAYIGIEDFHNLVHTEKFGLLKKMSLSRNS